MVEYSTSYVVLALIDLGRMAFSSLTHERLLHIKISCLGRCASVNCKINLHTNKTPRPW